MKVFKWFLPCLLAVGLLCGCAGKPAQAPELPQLAEELSQAAVFSTPVSQVDGAVALSVYGIDGAAVESGVYYFSSGASADELALIKAADESAAADVFSAFEARIRFQLDGYADYMPEELPKLEDALVYRAGSYVLLCVAQESDPVQAVMDKYF